MTRAEGFDVRRAVAGDEAALRDVRLQALRDAPDAFGSTLERELARTTEDWRRWMTPGATFILYDFETPRGLVAGARREDDSSVVQLMAMWVDPALRGTGAADALVSALVAWAVADGAREVRLRVVKDNDRARRLYERHAFCVTGPEILRPRDGVVELEMQLALSSEGCAKVDVAAPVDEQRNR
jgi:ribosomal protein S18 acetylase RimI-like enzyme